MQPLLNDVVRLGAAPGAAVALSHGGARTFAGAGTAVSTASVPLTPDSRVQLGCIAKLMTAIVTLELAADRRLDLEAPIERYLPELRDTLLGRCIRPWHLLAHTSGYRGPNIADPVIRYYYTWDKLVALLREDGKLFDPGTFFNYDHTESVLLGAIAERVTKTDIGVLHRKVILAPLGIEAPKTCESTARQGPAEHDLAEHEFDPVTGGFLPLRAAPRCAFWRASLSDATLSLLELLKLAEAIAGVDPGRLLRRETVSTLRDPRVWLPPCLGGSLREDVPSSFGCGCAQYESGVFGHNGSARGQTCSLRYNPSSGLVAVVALNAWRPHVRDMLCRKIVAASGGAGPALFTEALPDWPFADVTGDYIGAAGASAEVREQEGQLICSLRTSRAGQAVRLTVTRTPDGRLQLASDVPQMTLGFSCGEPPAARLMITGLNAYRRVG